MVNGFLLSILSPVWRAKLCGDIGDMPRIVIKLEEDAERIHSITGSELWRTDNRCRRITGAGRVGDDG
jgi:hypothetical protein